MRLKNQNIDIIEGRWWKIRNNIKATISAKYDKIKEFFEILDTFIKTLLDLDKEIKKLKIKPLKAKIEETFDKIMNLFKVSKNHFIRDSQS